MGSPGSWPRCVGRERSRWARRARGGPGRAREPRRGQYQWGGHAGGSGSADGCGAATIASPPVAASQKLGRGALGLFVGPHGRRDAPTQRGWSRVRDVEEAQLLGVAHLLVVALCSSKASVCALREPHLVQTVGRKQHLDRAGSPGHLGGRAGAHDDQELQPLGAVDRHDAHRVVVGLGQYGRRPRPRCPAASPRRGSRAASHRPRRRARLVDDDGLGATSRKRLPRRRPPARGAHARCAPAGRSGSQVGTRAAPR